MKNKKVLLMCGIVVTLTIAVFLLFRILRNNSIETEGEYTGYQLILVANYGGYGIAGQDLGSGTEKKIFNISEKDTLYEPFMGGVWALNVDVIQEKIGNLGISNYSEILEIVKIEEDQVQIKNKDKNYNLKYNEKMDISSNTTIFDGTNYSYIVSIIKK